jgi:DNA-binding SARP family transcriptional activator/basic membrane lipoprotein Med (substrate-binding protein (PBP1-ABC) superfamily)
MQLSVLGPLAARVSGQEVSLGGAKQRAVLAVLLLQAGEVVSMARLVDEVWGDDPPPSVAHSLEAYVSRLRQAFNGHGPTLTRRGAGYCLELGEAELDARTFLDLHAEAAEAAAEGDHERASDCARTALGLWRGPALADVALASSGRAEAERLEELRLRTFEVRFDSELALGRDDELVGELRALVAQNPYRERFVAQLMLALYRSGRHADALDVYERTRAALSDDLGLQPSLELQHLSGQVVRQDPQLRRPSSTRPREHRSPPLGRRARHFTELVAVGGIVVATMALTASGSAPGASGAELAASSTKRVALVLPRAPETATIDDERTRGTLRGFEIAARYGNDTEVLVSEEIDPVPADLERVTRRVRQGRLSFVLVLGGGDTARELAGLVRELPETRFVFLDESLSALSLEGVENATGAPFADDESAELAGYLSGLVPPRGAPPDERADVVSVVAGRPSARTRKVVAAFGRGVRSALPGTLLRVDYSNELVDPTACEQLASRQIDEGSDVVFTLAGRCGLGALAVARLRGVWGIRAEDDGAPAGRHILATTHKAWESATTGLVNALQLGILPGGRDVVLGIADEYAVDVTGAAAAGRVWSKVVRRCSRIRQHTVRDLP